MATAAPVIFILGAGSNVGAAVSRLFSQKGYKVALASRRLTDGPASDGSYNVQVDLAKPETVTRAFEKVTSEIGAPGVVVYNAAAASGVPANAPLELGADLATFQSNLNINTTSVLVAAHEATKGFKTLPNTASRTFIYTGNLLNSEPIPALLNLGIGKSATAHIMHAASISYADQGYRFYYADERNADGSVVGNKISGEAHGEFYWHLAQRKDQGEWLATFVKGQGYTRFQDGPYLKNTKA